MATAPSCLFLDIGGVLLTNGWDRFARRRAAEKFHLDFDEMDERHHLTFDTYEAGKLNLEEYLSRVVFHTKTSCTRKEFQDFMFAQSKAYPDMIGLVRGLKERFHLKTAAVSNEGRELTLHRVETFQLRSFLDLCISSCFVHIRKPDADIYRLALDMAQVKAEEVVYVDDRAMFVEVAGSLGIRGIHHTGYASTRDALAQIGFVLTD